MCTLWNRANEIDAEAGYIAFKHVLRVSHPERPVERGQYEEFLRSIRGMVAGPFPVPDGAEDVPEATRPAAGHGARDSGFSVGGDLDAAALRITREWCRALRNEVRTVSHLMIN